MTKKIFPIVAYGMPILKKMAEDVDITQKEELQALFDAMFETMEYTNGVGLAAPQINQSLRLFVIDSRRAAKSRRKAGEKGIREVFINPEIIEEGEELVPYEEGCLSIPDVFANVMRPDRIVIEYTNADFERVTEEFTGFTSRVIQHEYDHIEGILFVDRIKPLKKQLLKKKLDEIRLGKTTGINYKMIFNKTK